jgi:hypothetical protein
MNDPVTIGTLAASALAMAMEALGKGVLGDDAKDAFYSLKDKIVQWASSDVAALETTPMSEARKAVVAEGIEQRSPEDEESVRVLAVALIEALARDVRKVPIGIDIGRLEAMRVQLEPITVLEGGADFLAVEVRTLGDFTTGAINVGSLSGKQDWVQVSANLPDATERVPAYLPRTAYDSFQRCLSDGAGHELRYFDEDFAEHLLSDAMDRLGIIARDMSDLAAETAIDLALIEVKRTQIDRALAENQALLRELTGQTR